MREIFQYLAAQRGFDWTGYQPGLLEKRLAARLAALDGEAEPAYLERLRSNPAELDLLVDALTLKVSSFFRDPFVFEYLAERTLPDLLRTREGSGQRLRLWSAGCAHGEEPFTLAMLLDRYRTWYPGASEAMIFATDVDPGALRTAREGRYGREALEQVRLGLFDRSFTALPSAAGQPEVFQLRPDLVARVQFSQHDLLDAETPVPPDSIFGGFDLILCRNVLIYLNPADQAAVCQRLARALAPGGFLLLGRAESLAPLARLLPQSDCWNLFRKPDAPLPLGAAP